MLTGVQALQGSPYATDTGHGTPRKGTAAGIRVKKRIADIAQAGGQQFLCGVDGLTVG